MRESWACRARLSNRHCSYQFLFGVITCILEANPELLRERVHWQEKIYEHAKFLTLLWGRGLFYLFQGSLALVQFTLLYAIVGVYMVVMGVLCIAMWKGCAGVLASLGRLGRRLLYYDDKM
ncbi:hypothetical protein FOZ63_023495 [Perkinsus olseni]|uniref:Uncharacterized protein n=1 Tax=Perkinsus olseni TaxID=32597 RepID=A0A7J6UKA8_PEROL|nr:hypothetical protein FOZ63_023495 [Perkinsus olseni]